VLCAVKQQPSTEALLKEWALLLYEAASFAWIRGNFADSEKMAEKSTTARKKSLGLEHPDTLTSMANLVLIYLDQGRYKEAEKLGLQVVETQKRVLGLECHDTLTSIDSLASIYQHLRRWKEAEQLWFAGSGDEQSGAGARASPYSD
jgi:hypothetical protein